MGWPDLEHPEKGPVSKWVLPDIRGKVLSDWHEAEATIAVLPHPQEELSLLGELKAVDASAGWAGLTVVGARNIDG